MLEIVVYEEGGSARVDAVEPEEEAVQIRGSGVNGRASNCASVSSRR